MGLWHALSGGFLDFAFPQRCVQCRRPGEWICRECASRLRYLTPPLCDLCGREIGAGNCCQTCARDQPRIDGIRAASRYDQALRTAIHQLKYNGRRALAEPLSAYLERAAQPFAGSFDVIVPVPLHPRRLRQRGFNQAQLLAEHLARRVNLPASPLVSRVVETDDQVRLTRTQRQANVKQAFACPRPESVRGRSILLVDDVCTTGSTLFACAAPLYRAHAAGVRAVVIARQDAGRE